MIEEINMKREWGFMNQRRESQERCISWLSAIEGWRVRPRRPAAPRHRGWDAISPALPLPSPLPLPFLNSSVLKPLGGAEPGAGGVGEEPLFLVRSTGAREGGSFLSLGPGREMVCVVDSRGGRLATHAASLKEDNTLPEWEADSSVLGKGVTNTGRTKTRMNSPS